MLFVCVSLCVLCVAALFVCTAYREQREAEARGEEQQAATTGGAGEREAPFAPLLWPRAKITPSSTSLSASWPARRALAFSAAAEPR